MELKIAVFFFFRQFDIREPHKCKSDDKVRLIDLQNHIGSSAEAKCVAVNHRKPEQIGMIILFLFFFYEDTIEIDLFSFLMGHKINKKQRLELVMHMQEFMIDE